MYLLLSVGLSHETVSWLMSGLMMGVILSQTPLAWLADRLGRAAVLAACNAVTLVGICCLGWTGGVAWLAFWLFVVGACSGAFYPLGLALLGERTAPEGMSRAGSCFLAINSMGSMTGPVIAGLAGSWFGPGMLFVTGGSAVGLILGIWIVLALLGRTSSQASPLAVSGTEPPARAAA
jgi:MFS family permease